MLHPATLFTLSAAVAILFTSQADAGEPTVQLQNDLGIPIIDLTADNARHIVVDKEEGQYLGHPTTLLLEDGKTILCVYPKGHGRGAVVYKRSTDGGKTWSDRLKTPDNWSTSKETPTLFRTVDAAGKKRVIMFSGLNPIRLAVSEDDGETWSPLEPVGKWGGIVAMSSVLPIKTGDGHYMAFFHDDGRFIAPGSKPESPAVMTLFTSVSKDGGLTWSEPVKIYGSAEVHLCEPGVFRSPDGKKLAMLLRENRRVKNSMIIFSEDEGKTWTDPRPLPDSLTGDRHQGVRTEDGRMFISFRDITPAGRTSPTEGDWVAWVGTWEDLENGGKGQYRVRLGDNHKGADCAYPGVELLPDGTIVTTTYGHWTAGKPPWIKSVRLKLAELDDLVKAAQSE